MRLHLSLRLLHKLVYLSTWRSKSNCGNWKWSETFCGGRPKKSLGHLLSLAVKDRCNFIKNFQHQYPIKLLCRLMQISRSTYYKYLKPKVKNTEKHQVEQQIVEVFRTHKQRYGIRRICAELKDQGLRIGKYICRKVMHQHGLRAIQRQRPSVPHLCASHY